MPPATYSPYKIERTQETDAASSLYYPTQSDFERNFQNDEYDTDSTLEKIQWQSWKRETWSILCLATLLSVIVTPFIIESNKKLRPANTEDPFSDLVRQLATTLANRLENDTDSGTPVSNLSSVTPGAFIPHPAYLRANTLWLISLVLNLTTILVGLLLVEWLQACGSYTLPTFTSFPLSGSSDFPSSSLFSSCGGTPLLSPLFNGTFNIKFTGLRIPQQSITTTSTTIDKRHIRIILSTLSVFVQLAMVLFLGGIMNYVRLFGDCGTWVSIGVVFVFVGFIFRTVAMNCH